MNSNIQQISEEIRIKNARIAALKIELRNTDYVVIRAKEQGTNLTAEFKSKRQGWRDEINNLENAVKELETQLAEAEAEMAALIESREIESVGE